MISSLLGENMAYTYHLFIYWEGIIFSRKTSRYLINIIIIVINNSFIYSFDFLVKQIVYSSISLVIEEYLNKIKECLL